MKICNNCGCQNADEDQFCRQCGASLSNGQPAGAQNPYPLLQALKQKGASSLFLVTVILYTANLIWSIITSFTNQTLTYYGLSGMSAQNAMSYSSVISLVGAIPGILICIGLWKIYTSCKKKDNSPIETGGFSLVRGVLVFELVVISICAVILILGGVLITLGLFDGSISGTWDVISYYLNMILPRQITSGDVSQAATIIVIWIWVVILVGSVLSILFYAKAAGMVKQARKIVIDGTAAKRTSLFVAVILMIGGVASLIGTVFNLSNTINIAALISGILNILFSVLIFSFRGEENKYLS